MIMSNIFEEIQGIYFWRDASDHDKKYCFVWPDAKELGLFHTYGINELPEDNEWVTFSTTGYTRASSKLYYLYCKISDSVMKYFVVCGMTRAWITFDTKNEADEYIENVKDSYYLPSWLEQKNQKK